MKQGRRRTTRILACCGLLLTLAFPTADVVAPLSGSEAKAADSAPAPQTARDDSLGRSTPYGTVIGFLNAAEREDYHRASQYLETALPAQKKEEIASLLKSVLDRGLKFTIEGLSRNPEGNLDDGLLPNLEKVGTASYEGESLDIVLRRVDRKTAAPIWLFSSETLSGIPDAAEQLNPPLVERIFPKQFWGSRIAFLPLPQWIFILAIVPLLLGLCWLLARGIIAAVHRPVQHRIITLTKNDAAALTLPVTVLIFALLLRILAPLSGYVYFRLFWFGTGTVLLILSLTWLLVRVTKLARKVQIARLHQGQRVNRIALTELMTWLVQGLLIITGLLLVLKQAGFELTTAVAGLSIGGVAIAFAAQKTIENLFGTVMIITDEPIRVGDFCIAGTIEGTVESIGLRSTRIRTLNRTLVTIPNGQLSAMNIENLAHRDKFLFRHKFGLRYETTADQLQHVLKQIRTLLTEHARVEQATHRTRFIRFGDFSLDIEVFAYVFAADWPAFLGLQEELLVSVMNIIEASGTGFAFPSQTVYLAQEQAHAAVLKPKNNAPYGLKNAEGSQPSN